MTLKSKGRCWASVLCLCTAFALAAQTANAASLASDDFSYSDGSLVPNGGWATFSGTAGDLLVASGQAVLQAGPGTEDAGLAFTPTAGALYFGIDVSVDDLGAPYVGTDNEYFAFFKNATTTFKGRIDIVPPTGGGDYSVGLSTSTSTAETAWATDLTFNTTYRVVVKYDQTADVAQMWIDAALETDTSVSGTTGASPVAMVAFGLRQASSSESETIRVDNLCIATTFGEALSCTAGPASGACTLPNTTCIITTATDCSNQGGTYQGDNTFCPTGACNLPNNSCVITEQLDCQNQGGTYQGDNTSCPLGMSSLLINEVDADQAGNDTTEFVELYNTGGSAIDFATTPHVLVFYNGSNDQSYRAIDLTGSVASNDYYVVGSSDVPNLDLDACAMVGMGCQDLIQNGADAVALYLGSSASFPNGTLVTAASLVDAVVYDTNDSDDAELLAALTPGQPQINEGAVDSAIDSIQRCPDGNGGALNTGSCTNFVPTPGTPNCVAPDPTGACILMDTSCIVTTAADCTTQSGTYQGDDTACPTGACVLGDTTCVITSDQDCTSQGGTYLGDASVCPTGACIVGPSCTIAEPADCTTLGGTYQGDGTMCPAATSTLLINEVDADTAGVDTDEFVELYNAGGSTIDFAVSPHVLVFYNGSNDASYFSIDLTGSVAPGGYYVVGSSTVANLNLDLCPMIGMGCTDALQNGADAVALYEGSTAVFPNATPVTNASIVDAIVYGTSDADATGLIDVLTPGQAQFDENATATAATVSSQRCPDGNGGPLNTTAYVLRAPTPGFGTTCSGACCLPNDTCVETDEVDCASQGGAFRGDNTTCATPGICDCATIEDVKLAGQTGVGYILCEVTVVETVNQGGLNATDRSFTVQDQSGANVGPGGTERGIRIVGDVAAHPELTAVFDALAEGDRVEIIGTTEFEFDVLFLRVDAASDITETGTGGVFNVPVVSAANFETNAVTHENLESVRVRVPCINFIGGGGTFAANSNSNVTDGVTTFAVRINEGDFAANPAVGTTIPLDVTDIIGVYSEFFNAPQLFLNESDDFVAPSDCAPLIGACCRIDATCIQTTQQICIADAFMGTFQGIGVGCDPNPCIVETGACCVEGVCTENVAVTDCCDMGGIYLGMDSTCANGCPDYSSLVINEIRIDQPSADNDEYFELKGTPGLSLDGLTYIVIGDAGSGTIEAVVPLDGQQIQADGYFLVAEGTFGATFPGAVVDLTANLNFENGDNVTHMLVANFTGVDGTDVDADDDCVLDTILPWCTIIDSIALVQTTTGGDCYYGPAEVGPDGTFVPGHVYRCDGDPMGPWFIGPFDPSVGVDTPGGANPCVLGACCFDGGARGLPCACPGNFDDTGASMGVVDFADVPGFVAALLTTGDNCADINGDSFVDGLDIAGMITRVINMESCVIAGCQQLSETDCTTMGGTFIGSGVSCDPDPCGPIGACCDESSFDCDEVTLAQCSALYPSRTYKGDGTTCAADCQIDAIDILECGVQIDCSGVTEWCSFVVEQVDVGGSTCQTGLIQEFGIISIPCDGSCPAGPLTFRYDDGFGGVCIFTASRFGELSTCGNSLLGTGFGLAP